MAKPVVCTVSSVVSPRSFTVITKETTTTQGLKEAPA